MLIPIDTFTDSKDSQIIFGRTAKQVLEDYLSAGDEQLMDEVFQKALMEKKSTFDFNVLIENGITPLGAINPAEGVDGQRQG